MPRIAPALTAKEVENLTYSKLCKRLGKQPNGAPVEIPVGGDAGGLVLRITPKDAKSFVLSGRPHGRLTRKSLGSFPDDVSLAQARARAEAMKKDPALWDETRPRRRTAGEVTFGDVVKEYIKREKDRLARGWEIERIIDRELLPHWRNTPMAELRRADAYQRTDALVDAGKPAAAHRLYEVIRRLGRWAARRDLIDVNPFADMEPPAPKVPRDRVLKPAEIKAVWKAWDEKQRYPFGDFGKLLLLTAQRLSEVAGMRWSEIDREAEVWTIPGSRTKSGNESEVPLSTEALAVLDGLPKFDGHDLVFTTSRTRRDRPISGFSKAKAEMDEQSGVTGWTYHDLRRTCRTGLAELGVPEIVAEKVLNHAERNVLAKTYNRHEYAAEKRDALERWGNRVREIVTPPPANVVKMREAAS